MLHKIIQIKVEEWRNNNYKSERYSTISELLRFQKESESLKYLRQPQFEALETYFYLRLHYPNKTILEIYKDLYKKTSELFEALSIITNYELTKLILDGEDIFEKIKLDNEFCKRNKLESVRETIDMDYPSYILALTMGTGKTILIGTIIALEFSLAMEYPEGEFMKNALVFAPGTTILESLKEISEIPFHKILPPHFCKKFLANIKIIYARDGQKTLQLERGGIFNLIITNTEKIKLRAKNDKNQTEAIIDIDKKTKAEHANLEANLRLQAITSLPNLGVFSDEAHNTYGQDLEKTLKRVRETINHIAESTNLICVVNTTGTPYYKKQILKDVVYSYRLNQGIQDNILKNIIRINSYQMDAQTDDEHESTLNNVLDNFVSLYQDVKTDKGCPAKIAFYFKTVEEAKYSKELIQSFLLQNKLDWGIILNTQDATKADIDRFKKLENPNSNDRIMLLVGKGKEGWNCPSLFATALIRRLTSSNNFILQASTRCLRQTPFNTIGASMYLDSKNTRILQDEIEATEGISITDMNKFVPNTVKKKLTILKLKIPPITIKKIQREIEFENETKTIDYSKLFEKSKSESSVVFTQYNFDKKSSKLKLSSEDQQNISNQNLNISIYQACYDVASLYPAESKSIQNLLKSKYPDNQIPLADFNTLLNNLSIQTKQGYKITETEIEQSLMLIKKEGFQQDSDGNYYLEIQISQDNLKMLRDKPESQDMSFHYSPYNFDSKPEISFFEEILNQIDQTPDKIEDFWFTGGITNTTQTDFYFEYRKKDNTYAKYFPDFVIKLKTGKIIIIEIKSSREMDNAIDGKEGLKSKALKQIEKLNPDKIQYEYISIEADVIPLATIQRFKDFIK